MPWDFATGSPQFWDPVPSPTALVRINRSRAGKRLFQILAIPTISRHAREILQRTDLSAATGRQFLADRLLSECPDLGEFDNLKAKDSRIVSRGLLIVKRPVREGAIWDEVAIVRVPAASPEELAVYLWWAGGILLRARR